MNKPIIPQVFLVFGYENSGSGSLTFPEDFDLVGVFQDKVDADHCAMTRNQKEFDGEDIDFTDPDWSDGVEGMIFEVHSLGYFAPEVKNHL